MIICLLCKKTRQKLSGLTRISSYMSFEEKRIVLKPFVKYHFGYSPLTQMFHSSKANVKINHIHKRAQRIVYNVNIWLFE